MLKTQRQKGGTGLVILIVIIVVVLGIFLVVWGGYNKAVRLDEAVSGRWAQVENVLVRRFDLIPNLMETVKGYAEHEKELFKHVADARTQYFQAKGVGAKAAVVGGQHDRSINALAKWLRQKE